MWGKKKLSDFYLIFEWLWSEQSSTTCTKQYW
jgi:hypothetical protein